MTDKQKRWTDERLDAPANEVELLRHNGESGLISTNFLRATVKPVPQ